MSTLTAKQIIAPVQITNAAATYYTTPTAKTCVIRRITFTNVTAGAITVTAHIVPASGSATAANKFLDVYSIAAHTAYAPVELEGHVLIAGDMIQLLASANTSITVVGSGTEIS